MTFPPVSSLLFYSFTTSFYNDEECSKFNNSLTENSSCNKYIYNTIEKCCNYIADLKNVSLNQCNDSIIYTCSYDEVEKMQENNDFYIVFAIIGILCLSILAFYSLIQVFYSINKRNSINNSYISID